MLESARTDCVFYNWVLHLGTQCYTLVMPTERPRHMITETDELSEALAHAERLWPELKGQRSQLLRKILEVGSEQLVKSANEEASERERLIQNLAGTLNDVWPANWREELADDWPR